MSKKYFGDSNAVDEYKKELSRIKKLTKSLEDRGYVLPENITPKTPKKITDASVRKLKSITPDKLYEKASYVDAETGEVVSGKVARRKERLASAQKANVTKGDFSGISSMFTDFGYEELEDAIPFDRDRTYDLAVIEKVRSRLENVPSIPFTINGFVDMRSEWLELFETFEARIDEYGGEYDDQLIEYLNSIVAELDRIIADLSKPSNTRYDVEASYSELFKVVSGMPLSRKEAELSGEITDLMGNWNPIE